MPKVSAFKDVGKMENLQTYIFADFSGFANQETTFRGALRVVFCYKARWNVGPFTLLPPTPSGERRKGDRCSKSQRPTLSGVKSAVSPRGRNPAGVFAEGML